MSEDKLIFASAIQQREMECVRGSNGYKISCIHESRGHLSSPTDFNSPNSKELITLSHSWKGKGPVEIRPWPRKRNRAGC
ncbi:LOW QUALITY PROTEIN: uncharacterized protein LOC128885571 [Hylaeus anthracinus]|uniref:LOW QUALITY PROTEIN: uncharacterized protein LOC128885571 n=1 Tax=Hylaeus anthracinus TaxID=313031 RepID=UPI0023B949DD|nr:LOW QUALITY PROTEIN: uncharacterized protein LOC128885571 [Hylaeus anthracinus]